ncbi:MAG: M4 family metallopeptidase [Acidobacteriota bacterium]|jgi:Zn-dependent metalloprotease
MSEHRHPLHCILPPYILERLAESPDARVRRRAIDTIAQSAALRATRSTLAAMGAMAAIPSPRARKHRLVYDAKHGNFVDLPGVLVREEGDRASKDPSVNEAYNHSGYTYDFYKRVFDRNSLDDRGMSLVSSVHLGRRLNNAFWTGEQMAYGDGDGSLFVRFTKSLDVVGHELTHGVITHTANLEYRDEPGALNEHLADVFGSLVKQWKKDQTAAQADWLIGPDIMGPDTEAKALRTFRDEPAFEDDPLFGTDPQPKHMRDKYTGSSDSGGVHINSGIPNHAFYLVARAIGGRAWEKAGRIWYDSMLALTPTCGFADMAERSLQEASSLFGARSRERRAVRDAWKAVGL